jgi:hypothetical protein
MNKGMMLMAGFATWLATTSAFAQAGEPLPPPSAEPNVSASSAPHVSVSAGSKGAGAAAHGDEEVTDHERVVGKFGVMYFGVSNMPLGDGNGVSNGVKLVPTPIIGARYWWKKNYGFDVGLGLGMSSEGATVTTDGQDVSKAGPAVTAFGLHLGVPVALATGKHYKFLVVPEMNFGYATRTAKFDVVPNVPTKPDVHYSGLRFDLGARIGSEIQFGFIGIPQLALQASVGLNLRHLTWGASQERDPASGVANAVSISSSQTSFGTTVQSDPWALFVNNISAIYYLP